MVAADNSNCPNCHRSILEHFRLYGNDREFAPNGRLGADGQPLRNDPVNPMHCATYVEYLNSATQRFGENSLPLCMYCFHQQCDWCWLCHLPIDRIRPFEEHDRVSFGLEVLLPQVDQGILSARTIVPGDPETHYCDQCLIE